jgi:hypothetical protein
MLYQDKKDAPVQFSGQSRIGETKLRYSSKFKILNVFLPCLLVPQANAGRAWLAGELAVAGGSADFFISLLLKIHWHICEAHFQLMFDMEYLPVQLFFVRQKGHFPKFLC